MKEKAVDNRWNILSIFIDAILLEMGEYLITLYDTPMKEELMIASIENTIYWNPVGFMSKSQGQSEQSYLY